MTAAVSSSAHFLKLHKGQREVLDDAHRFKVVVAGRRWGKCLQSGTRITMADGTVKAVEDVRPGDRVLTVNEDTYAIEPKTVQHLHDNGVRETVIVRTASRTLRVTPNHPLLTNNRWTEAGNLRVGDLVAVQRRGVFGDDRRPAYQVDFLAIWLAEGSGYFVSNTTPEIIEVLRDCVDGFGEGLSLKSDNDKDWHLGGCGQTYGRRILNPVRRYLRDLGLWDDGHSHGRDSKTKFIPDFVYRLPKDQLARFLNLFVACDGCITRRAKNTWSLEIGLANERMVRQFAELLLKFGIRGQIRHKVHTKRNRNNESFQSWTLVIATADSILRFADEIGALSKEDAVAQARAAAMRSADSSNDYLPIAHDAFVEHLAPIIPRTIGKFGGYNARVARCLPERLRAGLTSWRKQTPTRMSRRRYEALRAWSDGYFDPIADGDLVWEEILSVEAAGLVQTWDLTIKGNHNFFAEGIATHNTVTSRTAIIKAARKTRRLIWYVAPTYRMARSIMWHELLEAIPSAWIVKANETRMELVLINSTRIELKGADKPETLRGVGIHTLVIDEAQDIRPETWSKVLRPTLADTRGTALIIGTPKMFNWFYDLYMLGQRGEHYTDKKGVRRRNNWKSWQFPTITSPFIPESEIEAARHDMDEKSFNQEFNARFETMSGRVYHAFDRDVHLGDYALDPRLPIWVGQDFNIDPMSSVIMQPHSNGDLVVVDELVLFGSNTEEVAQELSRRYWRHSKNIIFYPDPAGAGRSHGRGESDLEILREAGFRAMKYKRKHPRVADRVNAVNRMLCAADGTVRLRVDRKCRHLITAFEQTIYKPGTREVDKSLGVEHSADAIGYAVDIEFPAKSVTVLGVSI